MTEVLDHSRNLRQPPGPSRETQAPPKKTACGICGLWQRSYYDRKLQVVRDLSCGNLHIYLELEVRRVDCGACGTVKRERLTWLADNPFYTKRFAFFVGRRCRAATIKDVAKELHLDWHSVKELEKQYMREQLRRVGTPGPRDRENHRTQTRSSRKTTAGSASSASRLTWTAACSPAAPVCESPGV